MMKIRRGRAVWRGDKLGTGSISTESGILEDCKMSLNSRMADDQGVNPEELIAAAHAGCFAMDLAISLTDQGFHPIELRATADLTLAAGLATLFVASSHIELMAVVPKISYDTFEGIVDHSIVNCAVSQLLRAKVTVDWVLQDERGSNMKPQQSGGPGSGGAAP